MTGEMIALRDPVAGTSHLATRDREGGVTPLCRAAVNEDAWTVGAWTAADRLRGCRECLSLVPFTHPDTVARVEG